MTREEQTPTGGPRIALIADDLTGAGDTAVQFLRAGWSTELQLAPAPSGAGVLAVTTDARALPGEAARAATQAAAERLRTAGAQRLYGKIDSTLRGPIRAMVDGLLAAAPGGAVAVVCPAFPANGRTVSDGVLYVDGTEVHRTAVGTDPVTPVRESRVAELLGGAHVRLPGAATGDGAGKGGPGTGDTAAADAELLRAAGPVVTVDAESEADLERVAAAVARLGAQGVPVGAAGLASAMAGAWAAEDADGPALVIVTSLHQAARAQVAALADADAAAVEQPTPGDFADDEAWRAWSDGVLARFDRGRAFTAVVAPDDRAGGLDPAAVARRLGALAADLSERGVAGYVVTGGDGARAVADALGARGIALAGEVAPGVPVGTLSGGARHGTPIVTKAGGFGSAGVLLEAAAAVRTRRSA
ncbi:four-carbon acid sugar kinase family protein [Nocardiopsis coralliicola]